MVLGLMLECLTYKGVLLDEDFLIKSAQSLIADLRTKNGKEKGQELFDVKSQTREPSK